IAWHAPWARPFQIFYSPLFGILLDPSPTHILQLHDPMQLLLSNTFGLINEASRIRHRNNFGPFPNQFLDCVLGCITGTRSGANFALDRVMPRLEHLLREIDRTIAGGLWANQRAAPLERLGGKNNSKIISKTFVLA